MPQCRPAISEGQGRLQRPGFHSGSTNPEAPRPVKWVRRGSHGWAPRSLRSRSCHERPAAEAEEGKEEGRSGKRDGKAETDMNQAEKPARDTATGKREAGRGDEGHGTTTAK